MSEFDFDSSDAELQELSERLDAIYAMMRLYQARPDSQHSALAVGLILFHGLDPDDVEETLIDWQRGSGIASFSVKMTAQRTAGVWVHFRRGI